MERAASGSVRSLVSGGVAGVATTLVFTVLHHLLISDIWFSVVPMSVAGILCGVCLAWSYGLLFPAASVSSWAAYVGVYTVVLLALGAVSVAVFDPVVPFAMVVAANEPPTELIARAMPLSAVFTLVTAGGIALSWGRSLVQLGSVLVTSTVLIVLLGLNVSVLGLVELTGEAVPILAEFFGLTVAIMVGYGVCYWALERGRMDGGGEAAI